MKKEAFLWGLGGFTFTGLFGTFLHFLYDLSGQKLWFFLGKRRDFWCIQLRSILLGQILIPVIFYTYNGAIGKSPDWLNISIFFICALIAYRYQTKKYLQESTACTFPAMAFIGLLGIALLFILFTFFPPEIGLFLDPISGTYGI